LDIGRRGLMLVLSSPSGAGKTSIAKALLNNDNNLRNSISVTTRAKRIQEKHGVDYFFESSENFLKMRDNGEFLEWAEVFGNYYGTPKKYVFFELENGNDVIFDIDWQGTQQIAQFARNDLVTVFILPPSLESLHNRLQMRAQDSEAIIAKRMHEAASEISHWPEYDYVIVNNVFEESVAKVSAILTAERAKRTRLLGLSDFVLQFRNQT
jgi:guanylate kinase